MENTTSSLIAVVPGRQEVEPLFINDITMEYTNLLMNTLVVPVFGSLAIVINIINIIVFAKMGVSDGVNMSFLILSIADGLVSIISLASVVCNYFQDDMVGDSLLKMQATTLALSQARKYAACMSAITTTIITIVRCLCVTMPLRVKHAITSFRQFIAIVVVTVIVLGLLSGSRFDIILIDDPFRNTTRAFISMDTKLDSLHTNVFYIGSFSIVSVCVVILSVSLRRSSKFREKSATDTTKSESQARAKRREIQTVKIVTMVAIFFVLTNLANMIASLASGYLNPTNIPNPLYMNFTIFMLKMTTLSYVINSCVNIIFYVVYNSRFRETCKRLFAFPTSKA